VELHLHAPYAVMAWHFANETLGQLYMLWKRLCYLKLQIFGYDTKRFKQVLDECYAVHFGSYHRFGGNTCFRIQAEEACSSYIHATITELSSGHEASFSFNVSLQI
jgi:hypothetical protein